MPLEQRLGASRGDHPGQVPAGEGHLPVVGAGGEHQPSRGQRPARAATLDRRVQCMDHEAVTVRSLLALHRPHVVPGQVGGGAAPALPVQPVDQRVVTGQIVVQVGQVRRVQGRARVRSGGRCRLPPVLATGHRAGVEQRHGNAEAARARRRGQPGRPGPDHQHVVRHVDGVAAGVLRR